MSLWAGESGEVQESSGLNESDSRPKKPWQLEIPHWRRTSECALDALGSDESRSEEFPAHITGHERMSVEEAMRWVKCRKFRRKTSFARIQLTGQNLKLALLPAFSHEDRLAAWCGGKDVDLARGTVTGERVGE